MAAQKPGWGSRLQDVSDPGPFGDPTDELTHLLPAPQPGLPCPQRSLWPVGSPVRLQTQNKYRGIVDCVIKTYRHESVLGFFKGLSFPLGSVALVNAVLFGVYSNCLLLLSATAPQQRRAQPPAYQHVFFAGCIAGAVQAYFLAPVDLVKVRLQNQTEARAAGGGAPPRYRGPLHCTGAILREEGPLGLFRGAWALVLRDTPTSGLYFLTYQGLCRWLTPEGGDPGPATMLVAGGCAGTASWVTATPLDVVKSRMQMDGPERRAYRGLLDCVVRSVRRDGPGVFFRGLTLNSARAFPVNAVTFFSYEQLLRLLG
ncbi:solute carrier family 25 member 45 isoform X2 [Ornithorhynchus anatinus]|uniref:solute carrier family 25 member 45 isoform X2 n=1 Tax=Ornithorhynchus anatinus TaxID=9258 RepID=UPI0010A806B5|nr:solute carrier family 25 member 45 isoform X2 [Ornithorhynchus anatinus]